MRAWRCSSRSIAVIRRNSTGPAGPWCHPSTRRSMRSPKRSAPASPPPPSPMRKPRRPISPNSLDWPCAPLAGRSPGATTRMPTTAGSRAWIPRPVSGRVACRCSSPARIGARRLSRLEAESIPERTFAAARALLAELAKRSPGHPDIPDLKVEIMQRHVDRGEGREALALLKEIEAAGSAGARPRAQRLGLLALRQTKGTLAEETRLYKAQLRFLAEDGSSPVVADANPEPMRRFQRGDFPEIDEGADDTVESRARRYKPLLDEALSRLEERDKTHRSSIALILGEMDRLPGAEGLWLQLASLLDAWNLDDELAPRYEAALSRFDDASWWNRMARILTRQKRQIELRALAERLAATFRGSAMFERSSDSNVRLEIPEQPRVGTRTRLVPWGDWVLLKALERFPHSPVVLHAALGRLMSASAWARASARATDARQKAVVEDSLLAERRWAIFAVDRRGPRVVLRRVS